MTVQFNKAKFNAGLVFVLARALQRRCPDHIALGQAAYWLRCHGHGREAEQLELNRIDPRRSKKGVE